jgi:hypothetical protein
VREMRDEVSQMRAEMLGELAGKGNSKGNSGSQSNLIYPLILSEMIMIDSER